MPCAFNTDFNFSARKANKAKHPAATKYELCMLFVASPNAPWNGGMMAAPNIIMIKNADPWLVYLPRPPTPNEKIQGHIIEQHKPPEIIANTETMPLVNTPISMATVANKERVSKVLTGFS